MTSNPPTGQCEPVASHSEPLDDEALSMAIREIPIGKRLEEALAQQLLACTSLGFARTAVPALRGRAAEIARGPLSMALEHLAVSLTQKAVLDAAATYDKAGEGASSLANALDLITRFLRESSSSVSPGDRDAARKLVDGIRLSAILQRSAELESLRFWRNKWAGHRTVDAQVDPWAGDHPVDFGTIQVALEQMRAAFHEFGLLLTQLPELARLHPDAMRVDDKTTLIGLSLDGAAAWPVDLMMSIGDQQAQLFLDRSLPTLRP